MSDSSELDLMGEFSRYTAPLVLRRLAKKGPGANEAEAEQYSAAVLFVDIIGYSAIAESFALRDYDGVEELAEQLNSNLGLLIRIITEHGGEVTKFAGDALVALWPIPQTISRVGSAARQKLSEMVLRATQCALTIQREGSILSWTDNGDPILRIGIAAGDVYAVHLGGVLGRWEFLLSGDPMVMMSQAKDQAGPGEVVLDPTAWSLVSDFCSATTGRGKFATVQGVKEALTTLGTVQFDKPAAALEKVKGYIPAAITTRIESGLGDWLSEIRDLTILFVKLPDYGTSIAHPYATTIPEAQAVMRAMQSALYKFEGSINKFNVDDKGITLVAAMGLPPLAHKDDIARGLYAALELERVLSALNRPCSIGVASGWVFCGPVGSDLRREYTVAGNSVNRASSLMQAAELIRTEREASSIILCDERSHNAIARKTLKEPRGSHYLTFERIGGVKLKGSQTPAVAYRPYLSQRASYAVSRRPKRKASFVGRKIEKKALKTHIQELSLLDSYAQVLLIEGEEGIGKTSLLREVLADVSAPDLRILTGAGREDEQTTPYFAWRKIYSRVLDIDRRHEELEARRQKVMRSLPALPGEKGYPALAIKLAPLLNPLLGLDFPDNKVTNSMSPEVRHQSTRLFLVRLLQHFLFDSKRQCGQPCIIVLDNGQWLDNESWRLAESVSEMVKPVLLIIASRPLRQDALGRPPSPFVEKLLEKSSYERGTLRQLPPDEMARIYSDLIGPHVLVNELADALWNTTGGNPSLAGQLLRHWRDLQLVSHEVGSTAAVDPSVIQGSAPLPELTRKIILGRIDRLSTRQQMIVKAAAGFVDSFSHSALDTVLKELVGELDLDSLIESLVELDIFQTTSEADENRYQFSYTLIRDVVRELMPASQRRLIYAAALRAS